MADWKPRTNWWSAFVASVASTPAGVAILSRTLPRVDRAVYRLSAGRHTLTGLLTDFQVVTLISLGAKSKKPRTTPLLGIVEEDKVVLFASNWGGTRHPSWYFNVRAHPHVKLSVGNVFGSYIAREAYEAERQLYWQQAVRMYSGFAAYERRTGNREIPIFVLTPVQD